MALPTSFDGYGPTRWVPTLMLRRGEGFGFRALTRVMSFIGGLCCGHVAGRRGSNRVALAVRWTLGGATMPGLFQADRHVANVLGTTGAGFLVIGPQFVLNFTDQSCDIELRTGAFDTKLGLGRTSAILAGMLQQVFHGPGAVFTAIGRAALTAGAAILLLTRERPSLTASRPRRRSMADVRPSRRRPDHNRVRHKEIVHDRT